jgi:predicted O-linked N-acetylglucosamine transferase (SPINDLY family)
MVTCAGETFASRVAASLLKTMAMPDCVTYDLMSYEQKIVDLLERSDSLLELRGRVALSRKTSPLFSTDEIARHLESAFEQMMCRYDADLEPEGFDVKS